MNRLKEFRETKLNISQRELSRKSGISPVTICKLESGSSLPRYSTKKKLAKILREPVDKVFPPDLVSVTELDLKKRWSQYCSNVDAGHFDMDNYVRGFIKSLFQG